MVSLEIAQERLALARCSLRVKHRLSRSPPLRLAIMLERHQTVSETADLCLHVHALQLTAVDPLPFPAAGAF